VEGGELEVLKTMDFSEVRLHECIPPSLRTAPSRMLNVLSPWGSLWHVLSAPASTQVTVVVMVMEAWPDDAERNGAYCAL